MPLKGSVDFTDQKIVGGWCFDTTNSAPVQAHLLHDGKKVQSQQCIHPRAGLVKKQIHPTGKCGFLFDLHPYLCDDNEHEIKVFWNQHRFSSAGGFRFFNSDSLKQKIFFLHIPKAAGTSLNQMISSQFARNRCRTHIEEYRSFKYKNIHLPSLDFVSGHLFLFEVLNHFSLSGFLRLTVMRKPLDHLISHFNWLRHIGQNDSHTFFTEHPEQIKQASLKIHQVDFQNIESLKQYVDELTEFELQLFDNCQTRYLLNTVPPKKVTRAHAEIAKQSLHFFDIVGTVEQMDQFILQVQKRMGWKQKVIPAKSNQLNNRYGVDTHSTQLREVLSPLIEADQILYDTVADNT
ncbi:MAG: sulfotransferase family 2 domain-containing protein [Deltaproteobacteria bacterium]|nr:sulfotransferase family 2 domain-containing protein [Deltaproteobacteria bacterium]MBN2673259.1 sulfotransferase family 2 domain-containing protein [Deltaproteobacteria bacterium]